MSETQFHTSPLTAFEIEKVAALHKNEIKTGFLSSLGDRFLLILYKALSNSDSGIIIVAIHENRIVGFVSGAIVLKPIYSRLLRENFLILPFVILPKVLYWKNLRKVVDLLKYSGKKAENLTAELLSIAVEEKYRGMGIAQEHFKRLMDEFHKRGVNKFKIVVGDSLIPAQRFYDKMGASKKNKIEIHEGDGSWVYEKVI